ncbi:MAG: BON domain-containing protein [Bdellovibrionota bacterium]
MQLSKIFVLVIVVMWLGGCWMDEAPISPERAYAAARAKRARTSAEIQEDERITALVRSTFQADPEIAGLQIDVDTFRADVTLHGFVTCAHEAERAVELAQNAAGVRTVKPALLLK